MRDRHHRRFRGVQRRFDTAARWYLAGLACGLAGAGLGIAMGTGIGSAADLRDAHVALNVLGLVGLVVGGTVPFFVATEARVKLSPRATARIPPRMSSAAAGPTICCTRCRAPWVSGCVPSGCG